MLRIGIVLPIVVVVLFGVACVRSAPAREATTATPSTVTVTPEPAVETPSAAAAATAAPPATVPPPPSTPAPDVPLTCAPPYPPRPYTAETVFCADPSSMERGSVTRIVDGDTFHALLDGVDETVRIFGIDTPERGEACFSEATDALRVLVATHGGQVLLVSDVRKRDRYDRLLRYVYTPDGLSIDAVLIARGFAHAWTDDGQLRDPLVALEAEARAEQRGCLWG